MELRVKYTIYNTAINMSETDPPKPKTILKTIHNAGFFSCATIRLLDIILYFNEHKQLPDEVESSEQFLYYKTSPGDNLIPYYYDATTEKNHPITVQAPVTIRMDCMAIQFDSYRNLDFENINPFVQKYFTPSSVVTAMVKNMVEKYKLNFENLCSVFFRGNDKQNEMKIPSYQAFIDKAHEIKNKNPNIKFVVQPDENEFLNEFLLHFPDSIYFEETPMLKKSNTAMFFELPIPLRAEYGMKFFAAVLILSKCAHVITHSGNGALWLALYRNNVANLHQIFNDEWI